MDRRFVVTQQSGTAGISASVHSSGSHLTRTSNSFIPTSSSHHGHHGHSHHGKHGSSSSNLQQHGNNHATNSSSATSMQQHGGQVQQNGHHPTYYQNMSNNHSGTLGSRIDHHHNQQLLHHHQQQIHQRTLTKTYSSHSSHYSSAANNGTANHNAYYGNGNQSTIIMNGGGGNGGGGSHQVQNSYSQIHLQQQQQHQYQQSQLQFQQQLQLQQLHNNHYQPAETEGLPLTLVESMRTLFDILDDTKQGKIRLSDIESRWESDANGTNGKNSGAEPLIKMGVMGYLRKVTPSDGMLTFDRFCAGLRLALITNNNNPVGNNPIPSQSQPVQNVPNNTYEVRHQQGQAQLPNQYNNQQTFQQQIKNMANNVHSANANTNSNKIPTNAIIMNGNVGGNHSSSNNNSNNSKSTVNNNTVPPPTQVQSNTMSRMSKIPSLSSSRLPLPNGGSGIPVSPNNRGAYNSNSNSSPGTGIPLPNSNSNSIKRQSANPEQGTTVAIVHHPPNPNPKPQGLHPPSYSSATNGGTLKMMKQTSAPGLQNRYGTKNGSLDNLKTSNEEKMGVPTKDRPPSAPLLDTDVDDENSKDNHEEYYTQSRRSRERARSHDRDREDHNHQSKNDREASEDGKRVNFVTPRQRTLSMPQLQLSKLKPKSSSIPIDDSPPEKISQQHFNSNTLKSNGSKSSMNPSMGSSIPTIGMINTKQKDHSPPNKDPNTIVVNGHEEIREKVQPPPPPKPPRNVNGPSGVNIPVTISTSLIPNNVGHDPPLSGSSTGSGASKPEIRNVLHTWQKGMVDKKPVEATLSVASVTTTSSVNTNCTTATAPAAINSSTGTEVKLRSNTKNNQRRRETPRRHTVQSGIDFSTLKRLKQLEQERDVLQQGISYLENAKDWYTKQLESADEKIELLSKGAPTSDYWSESHEERLNLLGCRISEVNSLLTALMDGSSRLPLHMNLQIPSHLSLRTITRLKEQNRQLTQEVSDCSHRVTQLETEKAMLLRQLFHQKNNLHADETVYM